MLDIKFIKENKDIVAKAVKDKNRDVDIDLLLKKYEERKKLKQEMDEVNMQRNVAAKLRDIKKGLQLKSELEGMEAEFNKIDKEFIALMIKIPNIPSPDTPIGKDDTENKILREWGEKPVFSFTPKPHDELGEALGIIDILRAGEVAGSRFAYLKGDLVLMQFALLQFCWETLTSEETLAKIIKEANLSVPATPFVPVLPPVFVKPAVQNRMARFMTPEEHYMFPNDDLMLVGSAEHTLGPIYMDKTLGEKDLPKRFVGYSTAFRREAGAHGKDTKGILRQHQFDKMEMESFTLPEQSVQEQELLVAIQEYILRSLKLPYQVVAVCTGDMGFPDYRQIDIETWMPGQGKYRETHSADLTGSFQSRRLNTRVKRTDGKTEPLHMNDATVVSQRPLIAIIENYQQADGSIAIPEVLQKYMGGKKVIIKK
jgi:seryl-tRNA synthetase